MTQSSPPSISQRPASQRVVVTAWGIASSAGGSLEESFAAMREGTSGVSELTRFDPDGLPCNIGGQVDLAKLSPELPEDLAAGTSWRLLRSVATQANVDGALKKLNVPASRVSVALGGHGELAYLDDIRHSAVFVDQDGNQDAHALVRHADFNPHLFRRRLPDETPWRLADRYNAEGPILPISSACAAGTHAIGEGFRMIRAGDADVVLAGGSEPLLSFAYYVTFAILGALARKYRSPETASRPFDRKRSGFVIAEGASLMVLTTLERAQASGAPILGEILGYGSSADCYRITDMHPQGDGALRAMQGAVRDAGLTPDDVEYINAHGTSTPINDPVETNAIKRLLGDRARRVPVSSNKSMLGHAIGAAGALEAVLTLRGMQEGLVLPTINHEFPDRRCDLDYVPNEARDLTHRVALSNSFGFGGQNACLCLGAVPD